jgi:hypothetical protein
MIQITLLMIFLLVWDQDEHTHHTPKMIPVYVPEAPRYRI